MAKEAPQEEKEQKREEENDRYDVVARVENRKGRMRKASKEVSKKGCRRLMGKGVGSVEGNKKGDDGKGGIPTPRYVYCNKERRL